MQLELVWIISNIVASADEASCMPIYQQLFYQETGVFSSIADMLISMLTMDGSSSEES